MTKRIENRVAKTKEIIKNITAEGYELKEHTISALYANVMAIIVCFPFLAPLLYFFNRFNEFDVYLKLKTSIILIISVFILIFIHEVIHGLFMGIYSGCSWKNVELGFHLKTLTPYCTCQTPIERKQYLVTLLMPTIILGILPGIMSIIFGSYILMLISFCMILGGGGDILIALRILRLKGKRKIIKIVDHPTKCGFYSLTKDSN